MTKPDFFSSVEIRIHFSLTVFKAWHKYFICVKQRQLLFPSQELLSQQKLLLIDVGYSPHLGDKTIKASSKHPNRTQLWLTEPCFLFSKHLWMLIPPSSYKNSVLSEYEQKGLDGYSSKKPLDRDFFVDVLWLLREEHGNVRCLVNLISALPCLEPSVETARSNTEH